MCTCDGMDHAMDSQLSVIADYARDRQRIVRIARWLEDQGLDVPKMTADPRDVCLSALQQGMTVTSSKGPLR